MPLPHGRGLSSFVQELPEGVMEHHRTGFQPGRTVFPRTHKKSQGFEQKGIPSGLRLGDRVAHPAFGKGVIAKISDKDKVEVLFGKVGRKLLHLGYTTLEKI